METLNHFLVFNQGATSCHLKTGNSLIWTGIYRSFTLLKGIPRWNSQLSVRRQPKVSVPVLATCPRPVCRFEGFFPFFPAPPLKALGRSYLSRNKPNISNQRHPKALSSQLYLAIAHVQHFKPKLAQFHILKRDN